MRDEASTYLGIELAGAKNQKTALAALKYFPRERKVFLLDIYDKIATQEEQSGDEALLDLIDEMKPRLSRLAFNVPLELPPCITCDRKSCRRSSGCNQPSVRWMREFTRKAAREKSARVKEFTPYTQRPIELWVRYQVLPSLVSAAQFEIDEALGGNRAPLTARMHYLKKHLQDLPLIEVWPKLTASILATEMGLDRKIISTYRNLEEGAHSRSEILEALSEEHGIFLYERDQRKLANSLTAFDAFLCAYTGLLLDLGQCEKAPKGFPKSTGWIAYPRADARGVEG